MSDLLRVTAEALSAECCVACPTDHVHEARAVLAVVLPAVAEHLRTHPDKGGFWYGEITPRAVLALLPEGERTCRLCGAGPDGLCLESGNARHVLEGES